MHPSYTRTMYDSFQASSGMGAFIPNSLLLYLDLEPFDIHYSGNPAADRVWWHEYLHFLQVTTTSFGLNVFLAEFVRAEMIIECVRQLFEGSSRVVFPIVRWRAQQPAQGVAEIIDKYSGYINTLEEDLATLLGKYVYEPASKRCIYDGRPVFNQGACRVSSYEHSSGDPQFVSIGSKAVMEGAASTLEASILGYKAANGNREAAQLFESWTKNREPDPNYYITIDLAAAQLSGDSAAKLLAISDLALCPPVEEEPLRTFDDVRYPGVRFLAALDAAKNIQLDITIINFHEKYDEYISELCGQLGWGTPQLTIDDKVIHFVERRLLYTQNSRLCDLIGPALTLLNGLALRRQFPSRCPNPLPNFSAIHRSVENAKSGKEPPKLFMMQEVQIAHPPPFVRLADGSRDLGELAAIAMSKQIGMEPKEIESTAKASFEKYYSLQRLVNAIWHGWGLEHSGLACLQCDIDFSKSCSGRFVGEPTEQRDECACDRLFEQLFGKSTADAEWSR